MLLREEGLDAVFARHQRLAEATRRAVRTWGLEILCAVPAEYSSSLTAVLMPAGNDADQLRKVILDRFDMSLGSGLGKVAKKVFRIGHLGDFNELMLMGTLCGVEMGLGLAGVPHQKGGADAAMAYLSMKEAPVKAAAE
jgi:alanine-glyoxylate transaminase / serine-glyoxylate transaminase / serine-pyruvate transaminase